MFRTVLLLWRQLESAIVTFGIPNDLSESTSNPHAYCQVNHELPEQSPDRGSESVPDFTSM